MNYPFPLPSGTIVTMENHNFHWVNPLFRLGHVPVRYVTNYQVGYPPIIQSIAMEAMAHRVRCIQVIVMT
jgi:hypothetical protein